jgi:light-independent protochlorophyllide reductase subunit B
MMGLEEHLLQMFREDSEFHDGAAPSHLNATSKREATATVASVSAVTATPEQSLVSEAPVADAAGVLSWADDAAKELKKIPFFVRGKARSNTERFARERGLARITVGTLYDAKAHFGR